MYLIDRDCVGSIQVATMDAVLAAEAEAFDEAVGNETNGGFDRTAVATFTGRISWEPRNTGDFRYNPLSFSAQQIHEIEVSRRWTR